jgi:hypothetical protein
MRKLLLVIFLFISIFEVNSFAQRYQTGVGGRLGFFSGLTGKHFITKQNAIEGLISFRWEGFIVTGLYEWQKPIKEVDGLDWYIGGGAHIGFWGGDKYYYRSDNAGHTVVGLDFTIGLEYTFADVPFSIGLDWKPAMNLIGDNHWWGDGVGLNIRYNFR